MFHHSRKFFLFAIGLLFSISLTANAQPVDSLLHGGDPIEGNPKGKVTVVEFFDYQCSHCMNMVSVMDAIIRANPNVRIVLKEFPIRGPGSEVASRAALAAYKQGKYPQFNHAIFATDAPLTQETVLQIGKNAGLNVNKLKNDMYSTATTSHLRSNYREAQELNVSGTPAFFIGRTNANNMNEMNFVLGEMSQSELQDAINKAFRG
jgi:protein-disulfide isomerase